MSFLSASSKNKAHDCYRSVTMEELYHIKEYAAIKTFAFSVIRLQTWSLKSEDLPGTEHHVGTQSS